jgi:hypothetical protein
MPRKKKQEILLNDIESLEGLCQEVYNDACNQINDAQRTINDMVNSATPVDVEDLTKIAKGKVDALKIKDSAIKIKLEIGKLQNDIIKHSGSLPDEEVKTKIGATPSLDDFAEIRRLIKEKNSN